MATWRDSKPTDKQLETIHNLCADLDFNPNIFKMSTKGECSDLIKELIERLEDNEHDDYEYDDIY